MAPQKMQCSVLLNLHFSVGLGVFLFYFFLNHSFTQKEVGTAG